MVALNSSKKERVVDIDIYCIMSQTTQTNNSAERLKALDDIEKDLLNSVKAAGQAIQELAKDKPSNKLVETHSTTFIQGIQSVESGIMKEILYLSQFSTGQAHEGSCYVARKTLDMAWHRLEHARAKINQLERLKETQPFLNQMNLEMTLRPQGPMGPQGSWPSSGQILSQQPPPPQQSAQTQPSSQSFNQNIQYPSQSQSQIFNQEQLHGKSAR